MYGFGQYLEPEAMSGSIRAIQLTQARAQREFAQLLARQGQLAAAAMAEAQALALEHGETFDTADPAAAERVFARYGGPRIARIENVGPEGVDLVSRPIVSPAPVSNGPTPAAVAPTNGRAPARPGGLAPLAWLSGLLWLLNR